MAKFEEKSKVFKNDYKSRKIIKIRPRYNKNGQKRNVQIDLNMHILKNENLKTSPANTEFKQKIDLKIDENGQNNPKMFMMTLKIQILTILNFLNV